jgi:hypothetical protein
VEVEAEAFFLEAGSCQVGPDLFWRRLGGGGDLEPAFCHGYFLATWATNTSCTCLLCSPHTLFYRWVLLLFCWSGGRLVVGSFARGLRFWFVHVFLYICTCFSLSTLPCMYVLLHYILLLIWFLCRVLIYHTDFPTMELLYLYILLRCLFILYSSAVYYITCIYMHGTYLITYMQPCVFTISASATL